MIRKLLSLSALAFSLFVAACGSSNEMTDSEPITTADVPVSVITAFNGKYPDALDVTWGKRIRRGDTEYRVSFVKDGKQKQTQYREREGIVIQN